MKEKRKKILKKYYLVNLKKMKHYENYSQLKLNKHKIKMTMNIN